MTLSSREQRVTGVAIHVLIGLSTLLTSVLKVVFSFFLLWIRHRKNGSSLWWKCSVVNGTNTGAHAMQAFALLRLSLCWIWTRLKLCLNNCRPASRINTYTSFIHLTSLDRANRKSNSYEFIFIEQYTRKSFRYHALFENMRRQCEATRCTLTIYVHVSWLLQCQRNDVSHWLENALLSASAILLQLIPMPVLYGVFLYMGITSLGGVQVRVWNYL